MKYPQLVSTRAVNAISDWLVSRLEQLGVEAPQIYTRLLLSLLQSSVQINDPIEFNSLETFIGNRKGGSIRRYLQRDANTLKKLNAVQCLSEIVSSEQELTTIENLVDELWEKFKDIEKQLDYSYGDEAILLNHSGNSVEALKSKGSNKNQLVDIAHTNPSNNCNSSNNNNNNSEKRTLVSAHISNSTVELETDPKKRYFNAFPALSKDMEDSFRVWRRNAKSLTWPADRANLLISSNSSGLNLSSSLESRTAEKNVKSADKSNNLLNTPKVEHISNSSSHVVISSTGGLKRKTKRRKSQSMSKGRTMSNMRKTAFNDNVINAFSTTGSAGGNRRSNRNVSPIQWDTDFEGYWEMGRDLIKEFYAKQSEKNTNRCTSANGAYAINQTENIERLNNVSTGDILKKETLSTEKNRFSPAMPQVDISFCYEDSVDDDDTYYSIAELNTDNSLNNLHSSPRRLYQRLVLPESDGDVEPSTNDVQSEIVQFKAKFNSNLASLWQNTSEPDDDNSNYDDTSLWSAPRNIPWPTVAPIKENLKNFWTNFYNHQFDLAKLPQEQDKQTGISYELANMDDYSDMDINACMSLPYTVSSLSNLSTKFNNTKDFRSMPYNMESLDKSNDDLLSINKNNKKLDGRKTPIGVFLQDSIWSDNPNGGKTTDTDESFYLKVWNSNKKLHNLDAIYEKKINETKLNEESFQFSTYGNFKWSEGINAGPNALQQQQQKGGQLLINCRNKNEAFNQTNMGSTDCVDASISATTSSSSSSHTLSSSGVFSGQTPSLQSSLQNNGKTKSLTEVYGINSPISIASVKGSNDNEQLSSVSLSNHSSASSGFMEYSRIKSFSQALKLDNIKQQQRNYQTQFVRPKEPDGLDNENLLGADRTHFQPIRTYENGYTFDICSALEVINYKRSDSGYLYYESDKYLEYTREDSFIEDESSSAASASPLYAGSNCEAATSQMRQKERKDMELVLKFRIMNNDIACQTDDEDTISSMHTSAQLQHPLYLIFSGAATDGIKIPTTVQACSDAIEALNKAVAAAAKAAAERDRMQLDTPWLRLNEAINTSRHAIDSSLIWTAVQTSPHEEIGIDEIDFCNESSCNFGNSVDKQWSMCEIEKRCQLNDNGCLGNRLDESHMRNVNAKHNNLIEMEQGNVDMHSLWGMCAACNCDYKSAPANNLLRDELKMEADEIMSDLKNMQDLYIGCGTTGQVDSFDNDCNSNYYWGRYGNEKDKIPRRLKHPHPIAVHGQRIDKEEIRDRKMHDMEDSLQLHQKETQQKVLQQVNKLIADLMRPEKANDTNVLADAAASAHRELGESLWPDDGDHNIWKQKFESASQYEKCASLRPSLNSVLCAEEKNFLAQLTWEHNNLAELWAKSTPPLTSQTITPQQLAPSSPPAKPPVLLCSPTDACAKQRRAEKVFENIQNNFDACSNISTSSSNIEYQKSKPNEYPMSTGNRTYRSSCSDVPVATSSNTFKRIQQFLNSSGVANNITTAKLKLTNRKRRHSASQNYAMFHNNGIGGGGNAIYAPNQNSNNSKNKNNNNNIKITDLNNYNSTANNTTAKTTANTMKTSDSTTTKTPNFTDDIEMLEQQGFEDSAAAYFLIKNGDNIILPPPKQTIITCKYWATIDPMMDTDVIECTEDTTFSCLVDKNDTILKHVTMLARPLTR